MQGSKGEGGFLVSADSGRRGWLGGGGRPGWGRLEDGSDSDTVTTWRLLSSGGGEENSSTS